MRLPLCMAVFALAGCVSPWVRTDLMFGRCKPSASAECPLVSDEEWRQFVDRVIEPRFPQGFTVTDAAGEWARHAAIVREPSKVLTILHRRDAGASRLIDEIRAEYKRAFQQESVLRTDSAAAVSY